MLWGELVKLKAGKKCEYCGKTERLNSHHIFSRSRMNLRWDTDNGISLCVSHHVFGEFSAHKSPIDFLEWLRDNRGEDWWERLRAKSRVVVKLSDEDRKNIVVDLKEKIEGLGSKE